jgi:hypothetical protein
LGAKDLPLPPQGLEAGITERVAAVREDARGAERGLEVLLAVRTLHQLFVIA